MGKLSLEELKARIQIVDSPQHVSAYADFRAERQGSAIASCDYLRIWGPGDWWFARIFIPEMYREMGLGGLMIDALKQMLLNKPEFTTLHVAPGGYNSNLKRLIKFYEKHGFVHNMEDAWKWDRPEVKDADKNTK